MTTKLQRGRLDERGGGTLGKAKAAAFVGFNGAASMNEAEVEARIQAASVGTRWLRRGRLDERGGGPTEADEALRVTRFNGAASMNEAEG